MIPRFDDSDAGVEDDDVDPLDFSDMSDEDIESFLDHAYDVEDAPEDLKDQIEAAEEELNSREEDYEEEQ